MQTIKRELSDYDGQALAFLEATGTSFEISYMYTGPYFPDDSDPRDVYAFTLKNSKGEYTSKFGDSLLNTTRRFLKNGGARTSKKSDLQLAREAGVYPKDKTLHGVDVALRKAGQLWEKPGAYDVLSCLTKCDPGTFTDFCAEFGYDDQPLSEYPKVQGIYSAVLAEYHALRLMFTHEQLDQLSEIQ